MSSRDRVVDDLVKEGLAQKDLTLPEPRLSGSVQRSTRVRCGRRSARSQWLRRACLRRSTGYVQPKSRFIWLRRRVRTPVVPPLSLLKTPNVRMNPESERPRINSRLRVRNDFGTHPGQQEAREVSEGELGVDPGAHPQRIGPVTTDVLFPVAGIGAGQGAERHRSRHEAEIRVRFTGPNKLVHLIGLGEMVCRLARGVAERLHRLAAPSEGFPNRNQPVSLTRHGPHSLMPVRQKEGRVQRRRGEKGARDNKLQGRAFLGWAPIAGG